MTYSRPATSRRGFPNNCGMEWLEGLKTAYDWLLRCHSDGKNQVIDIVNRVAPRSDKYKRKNEIIISFSFIPVARWRHSVNSVYTSAQRKRLLKKEGLVGLCSFFLADSCNSPMLMKIFKTGAFDDEAVDTSQATPFREFAPPKFTKKVLVVLTVKGMQASGPFG